MIDDQNIDIVSSDSDESESLVGQSEGADSYSQTIPFENFALNELLKESIGSPESMLIGKSNKDFDYKREEFKGTYDQLDFGEGTFINSWKLIDRISVRIVEIFESNIVLECLIDKLSTTYELREFDFEDFEDFELHVGKQFILEYFKRPKGQTLMIIKDDVSLINENDFPKNDFEKTLSHIKFRK
jgi:hypothetical protein